MTTYFSFAQDASGAVSLGGSTIVDEEETCTRGIEEAKEADNALLQTPTLSGIPEQPPLTPSDSSTIWDGVDDDGASCATSGDPVSSSREVLPAIASASNDVVKRMGHSNEEKTHCEEDDRGAFPPCIISSDVPVTVAGVSCGDEGSVGSNSPSVGAASILTLDTALQSLVGLALIEDDALLGASTLHLPPPPPPPGCPPHINSSKHRLRSSSSTTSETIDNDDEYVEASASEDADSVGELDDAVVENQIEFVHCGVGADSPMTWEESGTMTEDVFIFKRDDRADQASMTDSAAKLEDKGTMTEGISIDVVERKAASLSACIHSLLMSVDRLATETETALPGHQGGCSGIASVEMLAIDSLSPPTLVELASHIDELSEVAMSNADMWSVSLRRSALQNQTFQKEQRRWRRENGRLRDEIRHLKMQAAESVSQNKISADALKLENDRLREELARMKEEASGAFPTDKISAIALATSIHRGPKTHKSSFR